MSGKLTLQETLEVLYRAEINAGLSSFWDGGWTAWIGDDANGKTSAEFEPNDLGEIGTWLLVEAKARYPGFDPERSDSAVDSSVLRERAIAAVELYVDWCHVDETLWDACSEDGEAIANAEARRVHAQNAVLSLQAADTIVPGHDRGAVKAAMAVRAALQQGAPDHG